MISCLLDHLLHPKFNPLSGQNDEYPILTDKEQKKADQPACFTLRLQVQTLSNY